jgi:acyl-coenzyme A synthetase/AMP-(fatty) acid ligase
MSPAVPGPRAVEAVLRRHPCVWDAAAVEVPDRSGQQAVLAAVVHLAAALPGAAAELAAYCSRVLPAAQVPAVWVFTDALPAARSRPLELAGRRRPRVPRQAPRAPYLEL